MYCCVYILHTCNVHKSCMYIISYCDPLFQSIQIQSLYAKVMRHTAGSHNRRIYTFISHNFDELSADVVFLMTPPASIIRSPTPTSPNSPLYSLALSLTLPTFSLPSYFFNIPSLWYFQNCFDASLPTTRLRILEPPGCSSMKFVTSYTFESIIMYIPLSCVV